MSKLEIHFANGLVGHASIAPQRPLVIGSHHECDLVIAEPDVAAVHCRISSRRGGYRVEAAPGVEAIELNGRRCSAAPLVEGDRIQLGETYLVLRAAQESQADERTADFDSGTSPFSEVWAAFDRGEIEQSGPPIHRPTSRRQWWQFRTKSQSTRTAADQVPPGQESLLRSPLVWGLAGGLAALAVAGVLLWIFIFRFGGERRFDAALAAMDEGLYQKAGKQFQRFLDAYPDHALAQKAEVLRAFCEVRKYSDGSAPSPAQALAKADEMQREVGHLADFAEVQPKLAEILGRVAQDLAQQAARDADSKALTQAVRAVQFAETLGGKDEQRRQRIDRSLRAARVSIGKAGDLAEALRNMHASLTGNDPVAAYTHAARLLATHPNLATDQRLTEQIRRATELERASITWKPGPPAQGKRDAAALPVWPAKSQAAGMHTYHTTAAVQELSSLHRESSLVPGSISLVVGPRRAFGDVAPDRRPQPSGQHEVVFATAEGCLYAVDARTGTALWRRFVGYDAPPLPVTLPGERGPLALVSDLRHNELLLLQASNGEIVWRQPIGEPIADRPLVHQGRILLPTRSNHLWALDLQSGRVQGHLVFPQSPATAPVPDGSGRRLYLMGESASLYVLAAGTLECETVAYLGHARRSVRARPVSIAEYLVVVENHSMRSSRLHVVDTGTLASGVLAPQRVPLQGWVTFPPVARGRLVWVASDTGALYVFELSPSRSTAPLALVSQADDIGPPGMQPFPLAPAPAECWVLADELRRYRLSSQRQQLAVTFKGTEHGFASQPLQDVGGVLFFAQYHSGMPGVKFTAFGAQDTTSRWETLLGAAETSLIIPRQGSDAQRPNPDNDRWIAVTGTGHCFRIPVPLPGAPQILDEPFLHIDGINLRREAPRILRSEDVCLIRGSAGETTLLLWPTPGGRPAPEPHWLDLPVPVTAPPRVFGNALLVPGVDRRLYLLSIDTGEQLAAPLLAPSDTGAPVAWKTPTTVVIDDKHWIIAADGQGTLYRLAVAHEPVDYLSAEQTRTLSTGVASPLVSLEELVYFADDANTLLAISGRDLSTVAQWQLEPGAAIEGPWTVGDALFVEVVSRELLCLSGQGELRWRADLKGEALAGPPVVHDGKLFAVARQGTVRGLRLHDAQEFWRTEVQEPLCAAVAAPSGQLLVVGVDGTIHGLAFPTTGD